MDNDVVINDYIPAPLISPFMVETALIRSLGLSAVTPELRLFVGVIRQAFADLASNSASDRRSARVFFREGGITDWCEPIGLNVDFVFDLAIRAGYLRGSDVFRG